MINQLIDSVCGVIKDEFGEDYGIHTELVEHDASTSYFTVMCISSSHRQELKNRYEKEVELDILYSPTDNSLRECNEIAGKLLECLEYIDDDGNLLRGKNISYQVIDNEFHVFVTYQFYVVKKEEVAEKMGEYNMNVGLGGE